MTNLLGAALKGHLQLVRWLLLQMADMNEQDQNGATALHLAVQHRHLEVENFLCNFQAEKDQQAQDDSVPFVDVASSEGDVAEREDATLLSTHKFRPLHEIME